MSKLKVHVFISGLSCRQTFGGRNPIIGEKDFSIELSESDLFELIVNGCLIINAIFCRLQKNKVRDFDTYKKTGLVFDAHITKGSQDELNDLSNMGWKFYPEALDHHRLPHPQGEDWQMKPEKKT